MSNTKGSGKTDPRKSDPSFVMTADAAERYAPPSTMETEGKDLQEKGLHGQKRVKGKE